MAKFNTPAEVLAARLTPVQRLEVLCQEQIAAQFENQDSRIDFGVKDFDQATRDAVAASLDADGWKVELRGWHDWRITAKPAPAPEQKSGGPGRNCWTQPDGTEIPVSMGWNSDQPNPNLSPDAGKPTTPVNPGDVEIPISIGFPSADSDAQNPGVPDPCVFLDPVQVGGEPFKPIPDPCVFLEPVEVAPEPFIPVPDPCIFLDPDFQTGPVVSDAGAVDDDGLDEIGTVGGGAGPMVIRTGEVTEVIDPAKLPQPQPQPVLIETDASDPEGIPLQMGQIQTHVKAAPREQLMGDDPAAKEVATTVSATPEPTVRDVEVSIDRMLGRARYAYEVKPESKSDTFKTLLGTEVEACSEQTEELLQQPGYHCLVAAAKYAFDNHFPLALSPDAIWVTIVQGLAQHVNADPETCRKQFVSHEGKEIIRVIRNEFGLGRSDNDWASVFPEFSDKIAGYIGTETRDLIVSDFSTTGPIDKIVSEIGLMDTVQAYFDYRTGTMCGIPSVILTGDLNDWKRLQTKVENLSAKFPALDWWLSGVKSILVEIENGFNGRVDEEFWKGLYKWDSQSGGDKVNGWLLQLIPFMKDWRDDGKLMKNPLIEEGRRSFGWGRSSLVSEEEINSNVIPRSISLVPFIWEYFGTNYDYEFVGGIIGYTKDADGVIVPKTGWAVRPKNANKVAVKSRDDF